MSVAVPAAKLYTRAMYKALWKARGKQSMRKRDRRGKKKLGSTIIIDDKLREDLTMWLQLRTFLNGASWFHTAHTTIEVFTDASSRRWGGVIKTLPLLTGEEFIAVGDFTDTQLAKHINQKESWALVTVLQCFIQAHGGGVSARMSNHCKSG